MEFKRRRPERFIVYLDDGEGRWFSPETVLKHSISPGKSFGETEFAEIQLEDGIRRAKDQLLSYLSRRPHSRRELLLKALQKGFETAHIDPALDDLERLELVNDRQFCHQFIQNELLLRPCSKNLLQDKLMKRGISRDIYLPVLDEYFSDDTQSEIVQELADKFLARNAHLPGRKRAEKLIRHLQAKGFEWSYISDVLENARLNTDDETE
ncbi:MAG: RecX family transcriptional regulator [Calditrichaeota bacterium]|nr:RecX family transcriptional regulator [Calditrichota bacterium]MCB0269296.1 RecX family transcriptional regulator [Calditrichota bacterium]